MAFALLELKTGHARHINIYMEKAGISFYKGLQFLSEFAKTLHDYRVGEDELQSLTQFALNELEDAETYIRENVSKLERKICTVHEQIKKIEETIEESEANISATESLIKEKEKDIKKAEIEVVTARHVLDEAVEKEKTAKLKRNVALGISVGSTLVSGIAAIGVTVATAGLAAPVAAIGVYAATAGSGIIATTKTWVDLEKTRSEALFKENILQEYKNELYMYEERLMVAKDKLDQREDNMSQLIAKKNNIRNDVTLLTKFSTYIKDIRLHVTETLGKVEVLHESKKKMFYHRQNMQKILLEIVKLLSEENPDISSFTLYLRPVILEIQRQAQTPIQSLIISAHHRSFSLASISEMGENICQSIKIGRLLCRCYRFLTCCRRPHRFRFDEDPFQSNTASYGEAFEMNRPLPPVSVWFT